MKKRKKKGRLELVSYAFTLPSLLFFGIALLIPFFMGLNIAFTDWNGVTKTYDYNGIDNFIKIFQDSRLINPAKNTVIYALLTVVVNNIVTLGLALLFNSIKGKVGNICRLVVFIPCCLSGVLSAFVWKFIYRFVLSALTGATSPLGSTFWVLPGIVLIALWNGAGINMLIYYAALKNVPQDYYEAALIDGATKWDMFKNVTLPMIMPAFTICITMTFTNGLKEFGTVMSATGGGPARASETISMYIFNNLYTYSKAGYGQAIALIFLIFLIVAGNLLTNFFRKMEVEM